MNVIERDALANDVHLPLKERVFNDVIRNIRSGALKPGDRLDGERKLSVRYGVARGTIEKAMEKLVADGFVERFPQRGTYVRDVSAGRRRTINIALPFPEPTFSVETLAHSTWLADVEFQRGLMSPRQDVTVNVIFTHAPPSDDPAVVQRQANDLANYDAAAFLSRQQRLLQMELARRGMFFTVLDEFQDSSDSPGLSVSYKRLAAVSLVADRLVDLGYERACVLRGSGDSPAKLDRFTKTFGERGGRDVQSLAFDLGREESIMKTLHANFADAKGPPEVFVCLTPVLAFAVVRYCQERQWRVPEDVGVLSYAHKPHLSPDPLKFAHVHVPHFEMGVAACDHLIAAVANNEMTVKRVLLDAEFVPGETLRARSDVRDADHQTKELPKCQRTGSI